MVTGQRGERFAGHAAELSPQQNLDARMPPVLMFHGDADPTVPYAHAVALHRQLIETGNDCEFITIPGGGHGLSLPEWKTKALVIEQAFLVRLKLLPVAAN
jgi:acetyl esterase